MPFKFIAVRALQRKARSRQDKATKYNAGKIKGIFPRIQAASLRILNMSYRFFVFRDFL